MTEKQIFKTFVGWMGMEETNTKTIGKTIISVFEQCKDENHRFTTVGYDEFRAGAIFDKEGNISMAYIDSHVAHTSQNYKIIDKLIREQ